MLCNWVKHKPDAWWLTFPNWLSKINVKIKYYNLHNSYTQLFHNVNWTGTSAENALLTSWCYTFVTTTNFSDEVPILDWLVNMLKSHFETDCCYVLTRHRHGQVNLIAMFKFQPQLIIISSLCKQPVSVFDCCISFPFRAIWVWALAGNIV